MKIRAATATLVAFLSVIGWPRAGFAGGGQADSREIAVDRALGGMEEGSRMPAPEGSFQESGRTVPGSILSPGMDTRSLAPTDTGGGTGTGLGSGPAGGGAASGGSFEPAASGGPGGGGLESGGFESGGGGGNLGGDTGGGDLGGGPGGGGSIIDLDANLSLDGGTVDVNLDAGINTEADSLLELDAATDVAITEELVALELDSTESALIETDLGVEEGINEAPASGEAEAGIEANVDASGESDEPIDNPANGLSL